MASGLKPSGAEIRWYERSVQRRFDGDAEAWAHENNDNLGLALQFRAWFGHDDRRGEADSTPEPIVRIRIIVTFDDPEVSVVIDGAVEFRFENGRQLLPPTRAQTVDFVTHEGIPYLLGIQRGVMADLTRQVGFLSVLIPLDLPPGLADDVNDSLIELDGQANDEAE